MDAALTEIDRRAIVVEAADERNAEAAERQMAVAGRLNHTRKLEFIVAAAQTNQMTRIDADADTVLRTFDLGFAQTLDAIYRRAVS